MAAALADEGRLAGRARAPHAHREPRRARRRRARAGAAPGARAPERGPRAAGRPAREARLRRRDAAPRAPRRAARRRALVRLRLRLVELRRQLVELRRLVELRPGEIDEGSIRGVRVGAGERAIGWPEAVGRRRSRLEAPDAALEEAGEPRVAAPARPAGLAEPTGRGGRARAAARAEEQGEAARAQPRRRIAAQRRAARPRAAELHRHAPDPDPRSHPISIFSSPPRVNRPRRVDSPSAP